MHVLPRRFSPVWIQQKVNDEHQACNDYPSFQEKIADMFEVIAHILPPYKQIYEACRRNNSHSHAQSEDDRLAAIMSYVYADLIHFSLDIYRIFCRDPRGMFLKHLCDIGSQSMS